MLSVLMGSAASTAVSGALLPYRLHAEATRTLSCRLRDEVELPSLNLQGEHLGKDAALRKTAGEKPQAVLAGGTPHARELAFLVEAPDRTDTIRGRVAQHSADGLLLALVPGGQHDQVGLPNGAVLHARALGAEAFDVGELDQA